MIKFGLYKSLVILLLFYTFSTLTYILWPIQSPNKLIGFLIFLNFLAISCRRISLRKLSVLILTAMLVVNSLFLSPHISSYLTDGIYLFIGICALYDLGREDFAEQLYHAMKEYEGLIRICVIVCNLVLCIGYFDYRCYDASQWGGSYFIGYTHAAHTLAAGVCLLLVFVLYLLRHQRNILSFVYLLPGTVAILRSGARTFLFPLLIVLIFYYIYHIRSISFKLLALPVGMTAMAYTFISSSMIQKFTFSANNEYVNMSILGKITNGRTAFWSTDIRDFWEADIFGKLFGQGFEHIYEINFEHHGLHIWAHNDFINCLVVVGLIGLIVYTYAVVVSCMRIFGRAKGAVFPAIVLILYMLLPAVLNGFYSYQHYFYSFLVLAVLFMQTYCKQSREKNGFTTKGR